MPSFDELLATLALAAAYGTSIAGLLGILRAEGFRRAPAAALAVPLTQLAYSVVFQLRFMPGLETLGKLAAFALLFGLVLAAVRRQKLLREDLAAAAALARRCWWAALPLLAAGLYGLAQTLLLPPFNLDGNAYHIPRVFLFLQEGGFFPEHFSSYHQVVFPVGGDLLFYPFVALNTDHGLSIFSFSSYFSIGAAVYCLARYFTGVARAGLLVLVFLSLDLVVLQAVTVKNDILVAAVTASCLVLVMELRSLAQVRRLALLALLSLFGLSVKLTFVAVLPGLAALLVLRLKPWRRAAFAGFARSLRKEAPLLLAVLPAAALLSQVWLFAANQHSYGSWNGPESFTHRHRQHDGATGTVANLARYALQLPQAGYVSDRYLAPRLGLPPPTMVLNEIYASRLHPVFGEAGATRGSFSVVWAQHEDFAWFGPLGAAIIFGAVPLALRRRPRTALPLLLPSLGCLLVIASQISWMPWNGRFFSPCIVALAPLAAIALDRVRPRMLLFGIGLLAIIQLTAAKVVDIERYLLPIVPIIRDGETLGPAQLYRRVVGQGEHMWNPERIARSTRYSQIDSILSGLPAGSRIGLYYTHVREDYAFYHRRPDLVWRPLKFSRDGGEQGLNAVVSDFRRNDLDALLVNGRFVGEPGLPVLRSDDGELTLFVKPLPRGGRIR